MSDDKPKFKKLESAGMMKKIMADHFFELEAATKDDSQKIAWCTSVGPAELLRALGYIVYFPENHGAMLGSTRTSTDNIPAANAIGFSPDICSYLTSDIGAYINNFTPLQKAFNIQSVPRPDILVFNTNQCRDVQDWFAWYGKEFGVPVVGIHTPQGVGEVTEAHIQSVAEQLKDITEPLEKAADTELDMGAFKRIVGLSKECSTLWRKTLMTSTAIPSPFTFFDGTIHMGPAVVWRGMEIANEYYKTLLSELEQRVKDGVAAIDDERHRLYWEGMPVWGKLRDNSTMFMKLKTCVVASTYCNSWIFDALDASTPYESMARAYTELFIVRSDEHKQRYIKEMLKTFSCDGIIYHDAKTCPNNSNNRYRMPERLSKATGIPSITINGDLNDLRCYSDEQTQTNVEAFIEQLDEK